MTGFDDPRSRESEELAFKAAGALLRGDAAVAQDLFVRAAELEEQAAADVDEKQPRVKAALAVSSVALWYKAKRFARAETLAKYWLTTNAICGVDYVAELTKLMEAARKQLDR